MPQVKNENVDAGWFKNLATDNNDKPRPLSLGVITFKAGQARHLQARTLLESRHSVSAFKNALANGKLAGPAKTKDGPWDTSLSLALPDGDVKAPAPAESAMPPADETPSDKTPEDSTPPAEDPPAEDPPADPPVDPPAEEDAEPTNPGIDPDPTKPEGEPAADPEVSGEGEAEASDDDGDDKPTKKKRRSRRRSS